MGLEINVSKYLWHNIIVSKNLNRNKIFKFNISIVINLNIIFIFQILSNSVARGIEFYRDYCTVEFLKTS